MYSIPRTGQYVEAQCIISLGHIHRKSDMVVPALLPYLAKTPIPDCSAMESLVEFGGDAGAAVPALLRLLGHAQSNVRQYATNALKKIDPEAAAKAGVK